MKISFLPCLCDFEVQKMDEIASKCFVKRGNGPKSYLSNIKGSNAVYKEFKSFIKRFSSNSNRGKAIFKAVAVCMAVLAAGLFASCDDDMDIQQSYPFTVETMPVPHDVAKGQTVEIRCEMKKEGNFANTLYTIRYFQYEGKGTLKMDNGTVFLPNDRYLLENEKFRLYYTSQCDETQNFIVVVEDNFGNSHEMEFDFNNSNTSETESDSVPAVSPSTSKQIRE